MDNILEELQGKIVKTELSMLKIDKVINGEPGKPGLALNNPIHISEVLRLKTVKLQLLGQIKAECYRASKLYKTFNEVKAAELRLDYHEQHPNEKVTFINSRIIIEMKEAHLEQIEAEYLVDHYLTLYGSLDKNIDAIKYKYNAYRK